MKISTITFPNYSSNHITVFNLTAVAGLTHYVPAPLGAPCHRLCLAWIISRPKVYQETPTKPQKEKMIKFTHTGINPLLSTDVYKIGHMQQYAPGTSKVYSYLCARSDKHYKDCVFFGLQYYLQEYLMRQLTIENVEEFLAEKESILGVRTKEIADKIYALQALGYWPLEIRAIPEGTIVPVKNALFTICSTHRDFHWVVGFVESLLLKVWYPTLVATNSYAYRKVVDRACDKTGDCFRDFLVHDFGYRSDTSEESAAISGAAHLICFKGSDTVPAGPFLRRYYKATGRVMMSVAASEHSVMCSYGIDHEFDAYLRLLDLYPTGILSIVSDTYDIYRVCTDYLFRLRSRILARDGKVVIRPDSGNPPDIICGDPSAPFGTPANKGVLRLLAEIFGTEKNDKGYQVLDQHIGLIYGDGMYLERYTNTLERMQEMGFAACNLVIGCGGILRGGTRDTLGFALKATQVEDANGNPVDIMKSPITDPGKKSHTGLFYVYRDETGIIRTKDRATEEEEKNSLLQLVFRNGELFNQLTFDEVIANFNNSRRDR